MHRFPLRTYVGHSRFPLALRLGLLVCVLSFPIAALTVNENAKIQREISGFGTEANAVRWIVLADTFVNEVDASEGGASLSPTIQRRLERQLHYLATFSRKHDRSVPGIAAGAARISRAWLQEKTHPGARALAALTTETGVAIDRISDSSALSFESHVLVADLGDVLDNTYYHIFSPLGAAAETMQSSHPTMSDRFAVAGDLAVARQFREPLYNDMHGALESAPESGSALKARWDDSLLAVSALESDLQAAIQSSGRHVAPATLRSKRIRLAANTSAFVAVVQNATQAEFAALAAQDRAAETKNLLLAVVAFALVAALGAGAIRLITRRDRRELERVQRDAQALAAELARKQAERARMLTEAQFDAVFDRSQMGIALLDGDGNVVECNPALRTMLGTATPLLVTPGDPHFAALATGRSATYQHETALERSDGTPRWSQVTISSVDVPAEPVTAIAMVQDISERKAIEERLRYAASHDDLTSLLNRPQFLAKLDSILTDPHVARTHAVLYIDLDRFKLVNDTLGHPAGDRAITITGERLLATTRPDDVLARLHGDEFALLLAQTPHGADAAVAAERIKEHLIAPIHFGEASFGLTASIGIVAGLERYGSAEHVMRDADVAMYHAKTLGRATAVVFDGEMSERVSEHMRILTDLRNAIPRGEMYVAYQPIVSVADSEVLGFEALLRWKSPTLGDVSPAAFIPIAEESDAIQELGRFALVQACRLIARLDAVGAPALHASVNLSVAQLIKGNIAAEVRAALANAGITPQRLTLEITESGLLENKARAHGVLNELRRIGVKLCIDDFGTGYSSLRYLHEFPIDVLKIDRSFVSAADGGLSNPPIVEMILSLARNLGVSVVAEGVETETQRLGLLAAGCEAAQGYLFARALPEAQFMTWLHAGQELRGAAAIVRAS